MTNITYRDGVAIGELVVYLPALAIAVFLAARHGFGRSSGWLFLIIFSVVRIVGSCFQLATISDPTSTALLTGVSILQTVGLSPLELTSLGLLSRIISSINKSHTTFTQHYHVKLIQTVVIVGLILSIVGGVNASTDLTKTGIYTVQTLSKVAMGLFIASFVLIVLITILLCFSVSYAEPGEKRLLFAVGLSLPFLVVRLLYSVISIFGNLSDFSPLGGSVTIYLCMALIMEFCIVIIYEAVGLTLRKLDKYQPPARGEVQVDENYVQGPSKASQFASTLGRRTLIGRLISSAAGGGNNDVEMQGGRGSRRGLRHGRY